MRSLRALPHKRFFGSLDKTKLKDDIFWASKPFSATDRLLETELQLLDGILARYLLDSGESARHRVDLYKRILPKVLGGEASPVFTHNDMQRKNIMLTSEKNVVLLDWATAGWYPPYWEYAAAMYAARPWEDDWHAWIAEIMDEFPNQFLWMQTLRIEMWS